HRAEQLGAALTMFNMRLRRFPSAYPAQLEQDLLSYLPSQDFFNCAASPEAGAEPINNSYVQPLGTGGDRYVLTLNSRLCGDVAVVLFSSGVAEACEKLPILCNGEPAATGSTVKGGTITFYGDSEIKLGGETMTTLCSSFEMKDGSRMHVVKQPPGEPAVLDTKAVDCAVVEVATPAATVITRNSIAEVELYQDSGQDYVRVKNLCGEMVVDGQRIREPLGGDSGLGGEQNLSGCINFSPSNSITFRFDLEKPDGTIITRTDLIRSKGKLMYNGPAVMIRFRPEGNGAQNGLFYNGEPYPLYNGRVYTITASDMTLKLFNDGNEDAGETVPDGQSPGRWWLYNLHATDAQIVDEGFSNRQSTGKTPGSTSTTDPPDPAGEGTSDGTFYTVSRNGRAVRSLGRGTVVRPNKEMRFRNYFQ
ncbi:unnamed protein product, partial [marine sediment metagenome]